MDGGQGMAWEADGIDAQRGVQFLKARLGCGPQGDPRLLSRQDVRRALCRGLARLSAGPSRYSLLTWTKSRRSADLARCLGYLPRHQAEASSDAGRSGF